MKIKNVINGIISVTLILASTSSLVLADLVYLRDGRIFEGRITKETNTTVRIEGKDYKKVINRVDIELMLKDVCLAEPASYTWNRRFSFSNALQRKEQISKALRSFRKLTKKYKSKLTGNELLEIGNMGWGIQYLGFSNWCGAIEGTLRKQNYLIAKLELELIREKSKTREVGKKEIEEKEQNYEKAKSEFETFWSSFTVAD